MKTLSSVIFLPFFLLAFSANFWLSSAQNVPAPVLDTAGQQLRRGVSYYILPADRNNGGGVGLENYRGGRCPFLITQDPVEGNNGIPLSFSLVNSTDTLIRLSTDLNIKFTSNPTSCPESNVWKLNVTSQQRPFFVTLGGTEGNPGPNTVTSWFKIERYENAYQIQHCPSRTFCPPGVLCNPLCGNIGILNTGGLRRLAFSQQQPFKIVFQRA
ncbi:hypothetical protein M9H77_05887 [Catharanthus roseus]|uniref:Uncharacterized protein n=1 Tax=Catharanthus roseus TaxID=4058 RepID=A0ACC0BQQ6_CATRO|nr:hypothetical protein M9H77_05887 [Catharanthus roseus]